MREVKQKGKRNVLHCDDNHNIPAAMPCGCYTLLLNPEMFNDA